LPWPRHKQEGSGGGGSSSSSSTGGGGGGGGCGDGAAANGGIGETLIASATSGIGETLLAGDEGLALTHSKSSGSRAAVYSLQECCCTQGLRKWFGGRPPVAVEEQPPQSQRVEMPALLASLGRASGEHIVAMKLDEGVATAHNSHAEGRGPSCARWVK